MKEKIIEKLAQISDQYPSDVPFFAWKWKGWIVAGRTNDKNGFTSSKKHNSKKYHKKKFYKTIQPF